MFDPDKFMDQTTSEVGSTKYELIPTGEYPALVDDIKFRSVTTKNGESVAVDIQWILNAPEVAAKMGREKLSVKQGFFIDTDANGGFDMSKGKNVRLNQVREAVGQNDGKPWKPSMLKGQMALVKVVPTKDGNYNEVTQVGKIK
jgi:hypothetical protein